MKDQNDNAGIVKASDFGFLAAPAPHRNRAQRRQNVKGTPIRKSASSRKIAR